MIADRDAHWAQSFWASVARHLSLQVLLSTSHHPQHDGQMECQNQTLEIALHAYVTGLKANWVKWLPALVFTLSPPCNHPQAIPPFSFSMVMSLEVLPASPQRTPVECLGPSTTGLLRISYRS